MKVEVKKHLDEAFKCLSAISVSGNGVDLMAFAKSELRAAYKILNAPEKSKPSEVKDDG